VSFEREVMPELLPANVYGFPLHGFWDDAGTPERLLHAQELLFDSGRGGKGGVPPGALGTGPVATMPGASARGASFGKYVTLGPGVRVEAGAHVERSILMEGVVVEKEATVTGSILGPKVRVGAGHRVQGQVLGDSAVV
jgi:mannose-1-phosphate guanylyltransferase